MSESQAKMNPIIVIAAIAVIVFSAVGVGVMTGVIPSSMSKYSDNATTTSATNAQPDKPAAAPKATEKKHASAPHPAVAANEVKPAVATCRDCGVIDAINVVEQKGQGTGLGAVGGAVVGGLIGNQVGQGRGNVAATVVGAAGGAYAGNQVEKELKKTKHYNVSVRMDDGTTRTASYDAEPAFRVGDKVKFVDGRLLSN